MVQQVKPPAQERLPFAPRGGRVTLSATGPLTPRGGTTPMPEQIIQDDQIAALSPSRFSSRGFSPEVDEDVRASFYRTYKPLRDGGMEAYHLSRLTSALYYYRPLLSRLLRPTSEKHVLEVGSGYGQKALAWADLFASYTGIELNAEHAAKSNATLREFGVTNARAVTGNAEAILGRPEEHGIAQVDLLVLYAVLEHLTIPERKAILRLAHNVCSRGGSVLIAESPNRLCRFDSHSWQLPFTEWLPDEILEEYAANSARGDLTSQLYAAPPDRRREKLYRLGRGVSFHEFECAWGKPALDAAALLTDGYSVELLNLSPFVRDEWNLLEYCRDNDTNIHRVFTRYWIEGIFSQQPAEAAGRAAVYLPPGRLGSYPTRERRRFWELDEVTLESGGGSGLTIDATAEGAQNVLLVADIARSGGTLLVEETSSGKRSAIDLSAVARGRMPNWHTQVTLPLGPAGGASYRVRPDGRGSTLTCHGALLT
jgi:SAM-dependent methyltransferase